MWIVLLGFDSKPANITNIYHMSIPSCRHFINMFLDALYHILQCMEKKIELPDPSKKEDLNDLAGKWSRVSLAYSLMNGSSELLMAG
jgi:hypothetical protein